MPPKNDTAPAAPAAAPAEPVIPTPETPVAIGETTVKVSVSAPALKATVEDIGGGTILTTVVEQDPRFDIVAGPAE